MKSHVPNGPAIAALAQSWLATRLSPTVLDWVLDRQQAIAAGDRKSLFLAFGLASRKTGKADLNLSDDELTAAAATRPGWQPHRWTVDQLTRVLFVLRYPAEDAEDFVATLDQLFAAAEVHELVALYQGLPLYPHPHRLQLRCAEGQRSNIPAVFRAIAHGNPYPSEQLNDDQWNQLVLKSLFIGVALDPIIGLDARANAKLAQMLTDFAHERQAAGRPVSPELWRCVGPFATEPMLADLERVLTTGSETERAAAALALGSCPTEVPVALARRVTETSRGMTWPEIAVQSAYT